MLIFIFSLSTTKDLKLVPEGNQSYAEFLTEFVRDISKTQIGEKEYLKWVPYLGTMFLFIFVSNWSGALVPWKVIELPNGELGAPTNDMCDLKLIEFLIMAILFLIYYCKQLLFYIHICIFCLFVLIKVYFLKISCFCE